MALSSATLAFLDDPEPASAAPIALRALLVAQPEPATSVQQVVQRVATRHQLDAAGLSDDDAHDGIVRLIHRLRFVDKLNIHLHCPALGGGRADAALACRLRAVPAPLRADRDAVLRAHQSDRSLGDTDPGAAP